MNIFEEVDHILSRPFDYPGLKLVYPTESIRVWVHPSFTPWASWTMFKKDDMWSVRRLTWDPAGSRMGRPDTYAAEALMDSLLAEELTHSLRKINIPLFANPCTMGIDGTIYGVAAGGKYYESRISFWEKPPAGLSPLASWIEESTRVFEKYLPRASTPIQTINIQP